VASAAPKLDWRKYALSQPVNFPLLGNSSVNVNSKTAKIVGVLLFLLSKLILSFFKHAARFVCYNVSRTALAS
jgi:hypothetical protein